MAEGILLIGVTLAVGVLAFLPVLVDLKNGRLP